MSDMSLPPVLRQRRTWLIAIPVFVLLVAVGGPWLWINVINDDPPERLSFEDATTTTAPDDDATADATSTTAADVLQGIEGSWTIADGSQAGYRVKEVLLGQDTEAVGRTAGVVGTMTVEGTTVTATEVTVDMTTVTSDEDRRDGQFHGRIMETASFPTATFTLTSPIDLGELPADLVEATYPVTGDLTLRGVTQPVTFDLVARRNGATIEANGSIPIAFDDFQIPDASAGPATVGRDGELELLLVFTR
jgi:polyisoprenoid-binding protein YceI